MASDGQNYLVVWTDVRNSGTDYDIYGARVTPAGEVLDPCGIPVCTYTNRQFAPAVAFDGSNYLVVWTDSREFEEGHDVFRIYGTRVTREGRVLDPHGFRISTARMDQSYPRLAFNGTNYLVVWMDWRHYETTICDIYGARVTPGGTVLDRDGIPINIAGAWQLQPRVAALGSDFYVVWDDMGVVRGSLVRADGTVANPGGTLLGDSSEHTQPGVSANGTHYLVAWPHEEVHQINGHNVYTTNGALIYTNCGVLVKRVSPQGVVMDAEPIRLNHVNERVFFAEVVAAGTDFWVVWQEGHNYDGNADIWGASVTSSGAAGNPFTVSAAPGDQALPCIAWNGATILAAWEDGGRGQDGRGWNSYDIYGARWNTAAQLLEPDGFLVSRECFQRPSIVVPPVSQTRSAGEAATFVVVANGAPLPSETQWFLVVTNAQPTWPADYWVVVTNAGGSVTSRTARLYVQPPPARWQWVQQASGTNTDVAHAVAADAMGNVYVTGHFSRGTTRFGPFPLTNATSSDRGFLVKYNSSGTVLWARSLDQGPGRDVAVDAAGQVYVAGSASEVRGIFVLKFDPAGQPLPSLEAITGSDIQRVQSVAVDGVGHVYLLGWFNRSIQIGTIELTSSGELDIFVTKFDHIGHVLWARQIGGPDDDMAVALAADVAGNAFVAGHCFNTAVFGNHALGPGGFLLKCDPVGNPVWIHDGLTNALITRSRLATDATGNVYHSLVASDTFRLGTNTLSSTNGETLFLLKYDGAGDLLWVQHGYNPVPGSFFNGPHSMAADTMGSVYVWSQLHGVVTFDGFYGTVDRSTLAGRTDNCIIVLKCDAWGSPVWVKRADVNSGTENRLMVADAAGHVYVTGSLYGEALFGTNHLTSTSRDVFLARLDTEAPMSPVLAQPPTNQIAVAGTTVAFSAGAWGSYPLHYQWRKNGTNLVGETRDYLVLHRVSGADAGEYDVVVSSHTGSTNSAPATLTVLPAPTGPGTVDVNFAAILGWEGPDVDLGPGAYCFVEQPDGREVIGGFFSSVNGVPRHHLARLLASGELDPSFNATAIGLMAEVSDMVLQPDGRLIVAGNFDVREAGKRVLIRLNSDGSFDPSFAPALELAWQEILELALQPDGKVVVDGRFLLPEETWVHRIIRLNPDGSRDASFETDPRVDGRFSLLDLQPDGRILVLGWFGGASCWDCASNTLARLNSNGSLDTNFTTTFTGWGLYSGASCVALQPDGTMLVGGWFQQVCRGDNCVACTNLVRLRSDGSMDLSFRPALDGDDEVYHLALQPDGKVLAGGEFEWGEKGHTALVRLSPDGSLDTAFARGIITAELGGRTGISDILLQHDGRVLIGGYFETYNGVYAPGLIRLNNDVAMPVPFVRREIAPGGNLLLVATPLAHVSVYAVEDQPPTGWPVTTISPGGVFDTATGKVKFGPFYDHEPRTLSYKVQSPVWGIYCALGVFCFRGQASADGLNSPIEGQQCLVLAANFPADVNPPNRRISIEEVTAYGAAWRRGSNWLCHAQGIPIDYVTRAGMLWRQGECYEVDGAVTNVPQCWVPCQGRSGILPDQGQAGSGQAGSLSYAERHAPPFFIPGEPLTVSIVVSPGAEASAFAVEDQCPSGWAVVNVSDGGEVDAVSANVKWEPFLDSNPRTLSYQAVPPAGAGGVMAVTGAASFDGASMSVAGSRQLRAGSRLTLTPSAGNAGLTLRVQGELGRNYVIETSTDLAGWILLTTLTVPEGGVAVPITPAPSEPRRFYRAKLLP